MLVVFDVIVFDLLVVVDVVVFCCSYLIFIAVADVCPGSLTFTQLDAILFLFDQFSVSYLVFPGGYKVCVSLFCSFSVVHCHIKHILETSLPIICKSPCCCLIF